MEQKERERQAANPRSRFRRPHSSRSSKGKRRCGGENKRRREKHRLFGPERMDVREGNFNGATGLSLLNGKIVAEVSVERERGVKGPLSTPQSRPAWVCVLRREKGRGRKREGRVKRVKVADKSRANREKWFFFLPSSGGYSFSINRVLSVLIFQPPLPPVFLTAFPPNVLYEFLPFPSECSVQTASSREMNSKSRRCCCWRNN